MGDPERLLGTTIDLEERELLASVRNVDPPSGAKAEAWHGISARLAAASLVAAAGTSALTSSVQAGAANAGTLSALSKGIVGKALLALAAGAVTIGVGSAIWIGTRAAPDGGAMPIGGMEKPARAGPGPAEDVRAEPPPLRGNGEVVPPSSASQSKRPRQEPERRDQVSAESRMLTQARSELRSGDARAAQGTLEHLQTEFPTGVLVQEREVLKIELLAARGDTEGTRRLVRAFISAHPESPHSAKLRRFLDAR